MTRNEMLSRIRQAGVIGAGGAGFPTYKKLDARVEHIIANGAECEPLLFKDRESMLQEFSALLDGLKIMQELTGAKQMTIALKEKNRDIAVQFKAEAAKRGVEFFIYKDVYPAGDEYVLVYEITGRRIPPGGIPLQVGAVVDNVETIINIAHAMENQPVTDKYVTVTGAVQHPVTVKVPIGTPYQACLEAAGGLTIAEAVLLTGGVMMGGTATDLNAPVSKTLGGLIALPSDHYLVRRKTQPRSTYTRIGHGQCDQCSMCTEMCPRYIMGYPIEPHKVMRSLLMTSEEKERISLWAQYCCECNICSYIACPEELDPKNICVDAKKLLREQQMSRTPAELEHLFKEVHPARSGREIPITTVLRRLGLTPYDRKAYFSAIAVSIDRVIIPIDSHIGQPGKPTVTVGQKVARGEVIADVDENALGCPAHSSIDGIVSLIESRGIHIRRV